MVFLKVHIEIYDFRYTCKIRRNNNSKWELCERENVGFLKLGAWKVSQKLKNRKGSCCSTRTELMWKKILPMEEMKKSSSDKSKKKFSYSFNLRYK